MGDSGEIQIRSFRVVFDLDRRLHRIDRWRLPLPYGLPLRSIGYATAALAAVVVLGRLPVFGSLLGLLPAPARYVLLPAAGAIALTRLAIDGRPAHRGLLALALVRLRPRRIVASRAAVVRGTVVRFDGFQIAPDARGPALRRGVVRGATVALLRCPAELVERRRALQVTPLLGGEPLDPGVRISYDASRRLVIR